jgi:hypothetical protein
MKVKVPGPDPAFGKAQEAASRTAAATEQRAADNDAFYKNTLMPRYMEQMDMQLNLAREQSARQNEMSDYAMARARKYDGMQDEYLKQVEQYDTEDNRERMAGMAIADVTRGLSQQRDQTIRSMNSMGVNPNSGAYLGVMANQATAAGLGKAAAANMAREAARREGMAMRGAASGMGQSYLGQAGGFGMQSIGAMGSGMGALQAMQGAQGANANQWMGMSGFGMGVLGDAANRGFQQQQMQFQANQANAAAANSFLNSGMKMAFGSDRRLKTNIVRVGTRRDGLGIYEFDYVWGGPRMTGVMADEVRAKYPGAVLTAGGYDMVDYGQLGG